MANLVTNILMDDEKYTINDWERKGIFVKGKDNEGEMSKMVTDTLFNLRRILIEKKINALRMTESSNENERIETIGAIIDYTNLKIRSLEPESKTDPLFM